MKSLTNYTEQATTEAIDKAGAFFAFSTKQFNEAKKEGIKYCEAGAGLLCPVGEVVKLVDTLDTIHEEGIKQDIKENGIYKIIIRELYNYECFYTGEIDDAISALTSYKVTREQIAAAYRKELPNSDD